MSPACRRPRRRSRGRRPGSGGSATSAPTRRARSATPRAVELVELAPPDVERRRGSDPPRRGVRGTPAPSSGSTRLTSVNPGESNPLPWPSTLRISWYSHGDICSSMSSWPVTDSKQSSGRRSCRAASAASPDSSSRTASSASLQASFSHSSDGLVDDLEEQLVAVYPLARPLLEREQLLGVEVALVVARRRTREDGLSRVLLRPRRSWRGAYSAAVGDLFSDAAEASGGRDGAAAAARAAAHARRARRSDGTCSARARRCAARSRRDRPPSLILHGPPGVGKTTHRADRRRAHPGAPSRSSRPSRPGSTTCAR